MNISEMLTSIEGYFRENKTVNTISYYKDEEIDFNKSNIYPLVNINLIESTEGEVVNVFDLSITILQQRDVRITLNQDNKRFGDNLIDNYNETYQIALKFLQRLRLSSDIDIIEKGKIRFINKDYTSLLDGVNFILSLEVDNPIDCE